MLFSKFCTLYRFLYLCMCELAYSYGGTVYKDYWVIGQGQGQTMKQLALLAVVAGLLCGLVLADYDDEHYGKEEEDWREENRQASRHCLSCNPDECLTPTGCVAGIVKDPCHCCDVCGKAEFELCDHPQVSTPPHNS